MPLLSVSPFHSSPRAASRRSFAPSYTMMPHPRIFHCASSFRAPLLFSGRYLIMGGWDSTLITGVRASFRLPLTRQLTIWKLLRWLFARATIRRGGLSSWWGLCACYFILLVQNLSLKLLERERAATAVLGELPKGRRPQCSAFWFWWLKRFFEIEKERESLGDGVQEKEAALWLKRVWKRRRSKERNKRKSFIHLSSFIRSWMISFPFDLYYQNLISSSGKERERERSSSPSCPRRCRVE